MYKNWDRARAGELVAAGVPAKTAAQMLGIGETTFRRFARENAGGNAGTGAGNRRTTRTEILETANKIVNGRREHEYGSPEDNFGRIAASWSAYLGAEITPVDVAMMMALLKITRIKTGTATEDSFIDLAGYAACGGEIARGRGGGQQ